MLKVYAITASLALSILIIAPVIALGSITNLSVLNDSSSGPNQNIYLYEGGFYLGDDYAFGNCTYWVFILRAKNNQPIPTNWGDAIDWAINAQKDGYLIDHIPSPGAIMQDPNAPGGEGHVAYVEYVNNLNGDWTISEMNRVGYDEVDTRIMSQVSARSYNFIHQK